MNKQDFFNKEYAMAKSEGFTAEESFKIASKLTSAYNPKNVNGKKSFGMSSYIGEITSNNVIKDAIFGGIKAGIEEKSGGRVLDSSGWKKEYNELKGDIGHFNYDIKNGIANDLEEKYHHFSEIATNLRFDGENLIGDIILPETEDSKEIKELYYSGQLGVSIEYEGQEIDGTVKDWSITGFSLHKDPDFDTKFK